VQRFIGERDFSRVETVRPALALDHRDRPGFEELARHRLLDPGILHRHKANKPIALQCGIDQGNRAWYADRQRQYQRGIDHGIVQREDRQFLGNLGKLGGIVIGLHNKRSVSTMVRPVHRSLNS
jgi:hypothetical protein